MPRPPLAFIMPDGCCIAGVTVASCCGAAFLYNIWFFWESPPVHQRTYAEARRPEKVLAVEMVNHLDASYGPTVSGGCRLHEKIRAEAK